jgi:hypothetical protein
MVLLLHLVCSKSKELKLWNNPHQKVIYRTTLIRKLFMEQPSSESYLWSNPHQKVIYGFVTSSGMLKVKRVERQILKRSLAARKL